ncbi:hypothetical protein [Piscinibacterium candidicorallinum]|uniref:Uncharacterized protein n=1 Tax=Piscinibacterium candidicorallinum TaxID=1793872 RepID=A0ABV7H7V4_9BURK
MQISLSSASRVVPSVLPSRPAPPPRTARCSPPRLVGMFAGLFAVFSVARLLAYLPTMWAIWADRDASQHSTLTWAIWLGANLSMAAWLSVHDVPRSRAVLVNCANALMCALTLALILCFRGGVGR